MAMNGGYNDYTGINPCDGVYGRATNNALIYAVQKEEGISVEESAARLANRTFSLFPTLPFTGDSKEDGINETNLIKILQYALYANGMYTGLFDGVYSSTVEESVLNFQRAISEYGVSYTMEHFCNRSCYERPTRQLWRYQPHLHCCRYVAGINQSGCL